MVGLPLCLAVRGCCGGRFCGWWLSSFEGQQQIPFGDDNQNGNYNGKNKRNGKLIFAFDEVAG
jgi:hypothetical protein